MTVLWIHAVSLNEDRGGELGDTIKYLEEARLVCERYKHVNDEMYWKVLIKLSILMNNNLIELKRKYI